MGSINTAYYLSSGIIPVERASASQNPPPVAPSAARELSVGLDKDLGAQQKRELIPAVLLCHIPIFHMMSEIIPLMVRACSSCSVAMVMLCMSLSS